MNKYYSGIALVLVLVFAGSSAAFAEQESFWSWLLTFKSRNEVAPVTDEQYREECGACHFPYEPGWLPEASWRKLLDARALENHFDENAELDNDLRKHLLDVLVNASADKSYYKRSKKVMASLKDDKAPLRITDVPYIKAKHQEVYDEVVSKSDKITSLSYCDRCHREAGNSEFDADTVYIPGFGYNVW